MKNSLNTYSYPNRTVLNTKKHICYTIFVLSFTLLLSCEKTTEKDGLTELNLQENLTDYLDDNQSDTQAGLSILIKHEGNVIFQESRGVARSATGASINQHTQFRIGSISKPFTAIAVMMLVEDGLISLDDKIVDILDNLPASFSDITVKHLLAHRAGLLDYIDDNTNLAALHNFTNEGIIDALLTSGLDNLQFAPGSSGDYSNTGYALLTTIVEEVAGESFPDFLKSEIFNPAGMTNSFVYHEDEQFGSHGENYALAYGNTHLVFGFNALLYGASNVISSTHDLSLFTEALLNGELISLSNLNLMIEVQGPLPGIADYGLGWMTGKGNYWHSDKYSDDNDFWHTGGFDGYRTVLSINPDLDLQVIILTNNGEDSQLLMFDILEMTRQHIKE